MHDYDLENITMTDLPAYDSPVAALQARRASNEAYREVVDTLELIELEPALRASIDAYLDPTNPQEVR